MLILNSKKKATVYPYCNKCEYLIYVYARLTGPRGHGLIMREGIHLKYKMHLT